MARVAPEGPPDAKDLRAFTEAVIEILHVDGNRPVPVRPPSSNDLHLLIEGWAYRAHVMTDGARQITDVLLPGDLYGWNAPARSDTAQDVHACGRARVAVLRRDVIAERGPALLQRSLEWARDAEARFLRSRLISLGRQDAYARVAHFLSELHDRLQRIGLVDGGAFPCPLTQEQLGDVLGLTSIHVNRVLQRLRAQGLVVFNRRRVFIPDLDHLHTVAEFSEGPVRAWRVP